MYSATDLAIGLLLVAIVILAVWILLLERRFKKLLGGKGNSIEDALHALSREVRSLSEFKKNAEHYLENAEKRLARSVQGVGTVRFQAFPGAGGDQSFASAFINEKGDGVVISSIYARNLISIYAKPIQNGNSTYELTAEEKKAIERAAATAK